MIDRKHKLSVGHQARLLGFSRRSVYCLPRPTPAADLALMRQIDELHKVLVVPRGSRKTVSVSSMVCFTRPVSRGYLPDHPASHAARSAPADFSAGADRKCGNGRD